MAKSKINVAFDEVAATFNQASGSLNDEDYCQLLQELIDDFEARLQSKEDEIDNEEDELNDDDLEEGE